MVTMLWLLTAPIGVTQARNGRAVHVHGAGAAQRLAAAELGAGHPQLVAQVYLQQGHVGIAVVLARSHSR